MYGLSFIGYRAQIIIGPLARSGVGHFVQIVYGFIMF